MTTFGTSWIAIRKNEVESSNYEEKAEYEEEVIHDSETTWTKSIDALQHPHQTFLFDNFINTMTYSLFSLGNPLLDMQVTNGEELLKTYKLKENDAILAGDDQASM